MLELILHTCFVIWNRFTFFVIFYNLFIYTWFIACVKHFFRIGISLVSLWWLQWQKNKLLISTNLITIQLISSAFLWDYSLCQLLLRICSFITFVDFRYLSYVDTDHVVVLINFILMSLCSTASKVFSCARAFLPVCIVQLIDIVESSKHEKSLNSHTGTSLQKQ